MMSQNLTDVKAQNPNGCIHTIVIHALLPLQQIQGYACLLYEGLKDLR
jgi:hypothetical protein